MIAWALCTLAVAYLAGRATLRRTLRLDALRSLGHLAAPEPPRLPAPRPVPTPDDRLVRRLTWGDLERVTRGCDCTVCLPGHGACPPECCP